MDADSSYGGSDTAQDSHSGHDNSSSLETTHNDVTHQQEPNNFYHKNEITLPVNYDETDFQDNKPIKQPHYLSTANLSINDTLEHHSNLEEMSKNYKSTSYLNESPKTINKSDVGVDNPAFQEEEYKPEVKSTFDHNKPYNGDLNSSAILGLTSPNKNEEPLTEAVNLELINLKPVGKDVTGAYENGNGMTSIPVKKESDAEIGNPYDEYFVPVNEHRKYMRGEKLYVTMDKRNKKKRNKCLCWGLCLCIVAAAVIIGILAAVGVIGNQGPHPAQEVSARHFGSSSSEPEVKKGGIFGLPKEVTQETTIPPETSSRFTPGPPVVTVSNLLPTTETSMIQVPRALESQLVIDNLQFTPALADKNSTEFKKLAEALETELKNSLFSSDTLNYGASNIEVKIVDFTPGSVVVKYRITWVFKDGIHGAKDPIDEEMLKKKMKNILNRNNGFMDTYHIDDNTVTVERILDLCKIENNGCEYNCSFDYEIADFVCSCPEGKYLGSDRKSCMDETVIEPKNINFHEDDLYATENPHFVQELSSEPEPTSVPDYHHHENEASPEPEPTSEPITEPKPTEVHHIIINEPSAEPEPTSEPITEGKPTETHHNIIVETSPEPEPTIKPTDTHYHIIAEPSAEPEPTSEPEPEPTNKPEEVSHENYINLHELEVVPIPTTEPNVEPHPEPTSEPNSEPTAEPAAEPNAEPTAEPAAEPTLVPIAEPSPEPTAEPAAEPNPEPTAEPAAEPSPEPNAVPAAEPTSEPAAEPSPETTIQPIAEPSPEPTAEPPSEPELKPIVGLIPESTSPEPTPEPKTEPITESNPEPTVLPKLNPEPASQPNPEPTTEVIEPKSEPVSEHVTEFAVEHHTEPVAGPTPESVIIHKTELVTEIMTEHPVENKSEPVAEPTAEPNLDHETTSSASLEHVSENKIEFASEPNTEHTIQPEMKMDITTQMVNHEINLTSEPNIEPSPVPIVPHVNPLIIETTTKLENEDAISSTESMTISPMTVSPMTSSSMSPTTMKSTESEFRHNHLSEEIFAEPEITTITNQQVEEVSKTTTIKNNESNTIENSVTTSVPNVEVKEEAVPTTLLPIFEVKEETPVTTSLPASEIKENSPITTTTTVASEVHPTTSVSDSEVPVTSIVKMDEKLTTTKPEMTTQPTLIETTINNQNHSENVIPVSVNEQTYHLVHSQNTTEESVTNPVTVPMIFNNEHVILHSDNVEVKNETSKPDMVETTPSSTDMSKIFTEIHKVMDDNFDRSTEMVAVEGTNHTHMNMGVVDSTENTSAMDNMSPFLPELGNDTFVNKLHLGEHIIPPIQNETHDDEIIETSPPRLDNDQMNVTNPKDSNPTDTPLQVVPLEGTENEIVDKEISTQTPKSEEKMKVTEPQYVPVMVIQEATPTTTMSSVNLLESIKDNATENSIEITTKPLDSVKIESTTKSSEEIVKTTLPPEIINNVHSNNYFETLLQPHNEENATSSQSPQQNILTSFGTSTEDLIALETTTNGGKIAENKNVGVETTTETSKRNESITTVHAEILTTVRESVNFANNTDENSTKVVDSTATATKTDEANITKATIIEDNNLTISAEVTTVPSPQNKSHQYEVQETFSDVTTTEKLFLSTKATTEVPVIIKEAYEDLSVVPLNSDDDNETSKIEEKRVAPTTTFGQLDAEPNDSTNDISQEEQSVLEKFHHNFNEINAESDKSEYSTTSKVDEISESNTELGHELFKYEQYNETKLKKNKDKAKFDKKAKLEKAISANDEILTTSLPSDKQPAPFSDVKPVTEDFTISGFSRCVFGQFQCINGTNTKDGSYCISVNDRCDSVDDCSDASDEIDCIKNGCPNNFQCDSGQCLKRHLVCDGIQHCNDGSDETNCDQWNCRFDEFSCGEKLRCIPVSWKCDGRMQCPNGSDEYNCPSTICNENSFHCLEQNTCVPKSWMCDGKADCVNAEDEKSCECGNDEFKCAIGGGCIKTHQRCDGTDDCADRSDEWKCMRLEEVNNKKYLQIEFSNNTWFPVCSDNWNQTHSDLVCRNLGYGGSSLTETVAKPDGDFKGYFKLKNQLTYGSPILSQIEKSDNCDNFISISCQEFTCGSQSTLDVQSARIIGGNRGTETQWPSLTLLYNKKHNIQCTATLIAPLWVMASHSCIFNPFSQNPNKPKDWILYAGNTNFFSNHDNSTTQVGQIKHIFAHPQAKFSQFDFANDVVLVELVKPLTMTRNVSAMCLPDKDIEPRQLCIIAGWGVSKPGEPGKNQYLHYLPVPIIDLDGCNSTKHYNGLISKGKICAGYTDSEKTPCYNDEGAPLMCFSDSAGTWELQGILSHHDNCARSKHPAIYTAINEKIRQWVINTIGQKPARSA